MIEIPVFHFNTLYKHQNNTDIAFELLQHNYSDDDYFCLEVMWWNIVHEPRLMVRTTETIRIPKKDFNKWEIYLDMNGGSCD